MNKQQTFTAGPVMVGDLRYGYLRHDPENGWRFIPETAMTRCAASPAMTRASSGRGPSRKWHPTADAALPRWVRVAIRKAAAKAAGVAA